MAKVVSVNVSVKKGTPKTPVKEADLRCNCGLVEDAHAGPGIRQVSLLGEESYKKVKNSGFAKICMKQGSFGENITTKGLTLYKLPLGTELKIGEVVLEVSKIGKECHSPCEIRKKAGICILPREGIFAVVKKGGKIKPGNKIRNNQQL